MAGLLIWISVPTGGGLLPSFAAGFPVSSTRQPANAGAPPTGPTSQLVSNPSGLGGLSLGAAGITDQGGLGSSSGEGAVGGGASTGDAGSPGTTNSASEPTPTTSSSSCPVSFLATNTPLDGLATQLNSLCSQLPAAPSGTVPADSLPGGSSGAQSAGRGAPVPKQWMYVDAPVGASGASSGTWTLPLAAEMAGKSPVVVVGLVQGTAVPPALAGVVADVVRRGALVQLLLVPEPTARGGSAAFASWVAQVVGALEPVPLVEIGTGAAPPGSSSGTVASYAAAGLAAAHGAAGRPTAGVVWLDGGTTSVDPAVWSSLDAAGVWGRSSFVATSLDATGVCASPAAFAATLRRYPVAAGLPVVSEAVQAPAPAAWVASNYGCLKGSVSRGPGASVATWRLWEGPVPR